MPRTPVLEERTVTMTARPHWALPIFRPDVITNDNVQQHDHQDIHYWENNHLRDLLAQFPNLGHQPYSHHLRKQHLNQNRPLKQNQNLPQQVSR